MPPIMKKKILRIQGSFLRDRVSKSFYKHIAAKLSFQKCDWISQFYDDVTYLKMA